MKHLRYLFAIALGGMISLSGCKKDDPKPDDENELITTVVLTFSKTGEPDRVFRWKQLSGTTTIDTIKLSASAVYNLKTTFLNEAEDPVEDITEEIEEEDDEHQIFYFSSPSNLITLEYQDADENSLPVGLNMRATTGSAATGTLRVVLRHQPGAKDGTFGPGSTDADVTFPVVLIP
jgi:hypothetical protein